jgi:hypothetical protein
MSLLVEGFFLPFIHLIFSVSPSLLEYLTLSSKLCGYSFFLRGINKPKSDRLSTNPLQYSDKIACSTASQQMLGAAHFAYLHPEDME